MIKTVRAYTECEVHVADNISEEESDVIAVNLAIEQFETKGIDVSQMNFAILTKV